MYLRICFFFLLTASLSPLNLFSVEPGKGKILICGVCKNVVGQNLQLTLQTMVSCGKAFDDYHIIIYENNSNDGTGQVLRAWARNNPKATAITEQLSPNMLLARCPSQNIMRTEVIAMARNKVLDEALTAKFDDFDYLLMADMDFGEEWDIDSIIRTTSNTEIEWDGVFANGLLPDGRFYDLFAYRAEDQPMGPEALGDWWWKNHGWFALPIEAPWFPVYSAFNGLAIYKRDSLKGSRYSGVVTTDVEIAMKKWFERAEEQGHDHVEVYRQLVNSVPIYHSSQVPNPTARQRLPQSIGLILKSSPHHFVWLGINHKSILPEVCEHIGLHASMANKGHGKLFINPSLITHYHE